MSNVFSKGGGSSSLKGGVGPDQTLNVPPFTSTGGITPEQQTLAQYSLGQDLLAQGNLFGSSGTGHSTMATQGAGGARATEAQQEGQMSDANQNAQFQLYENDVSALQTQLQNEAVLNQANNASTTANLSNLAKLAGFTSTGAAPATS